MKIKKLFLIILLLNIYSNSFSQNYKTEIETEFNKYLNSIANMEFEKSMEYILPDFFEIIPKSQMIKMMEQTFKNPSIEFEIKNQKISNIDKPKKIEDKFYSLITYSNQMNMKTKSNEAETDDDKRMRINLTTIALQESFGSDNVMYNAKTGFFEVQSKKNVYGISNNGITKWKFLVIEKEQKPLLKKLLPNELIDEL